jgi:hypothetical protein
MLAVIYMFLGWKGVVFQVVYAWMVVMFVDSTNYVEHYGLKLKQLNKDKPKEEPIYTKILDKYNSLNSKNNPLKGSKKSLLGCII